MKVFILLVCFVSVVVCTDEICGGTYRGFQYTITSPNYPHNYPDRSKCVYNLQADTSARCEQEFHLQFLEFDVRASENCKGDYLQVGDRHIFCGNTVGLRKFVGKNNSLTVIFNSDEKNAAKGFKILVTALPCSLKLNPLKTRAHGALGQKGSIFESNDIPYSDAYQREIRGDTENDNSFTGLVPNNNNTLTEQQKSSAFLRPQIDFMSQNSVSPSGKTTSRITSYLFLPPTDNNNSSVFTTTIKDKVLDIVTLPSNDLLPPNQKPAIVFSKVQSPKDGLFFSALDKSSSLTGQTQRLASVPARNYGEPGVGVVDYDQHVSNDCDGSSVQQSNDNVRGPSEKINYDPLISQGFLGNNNPNLIYDPRYGLINGNYPGAGYNPSQSYPGSYPGNGYNPVDYPGTGYPGAGYPNTGYPGNGYPGTSYPGTGYPGTGYPGNGYPGTSYPGNGYPGTSYPGTGYPGDGYNTNGGYYPNFPNGNYNPNHPIGPGYIPEYNPSYAPDYISGYQPGYNPSFGGGFRPNYPGSGWGNSFVNQGECCRVPSTRRFSLVSPGFPGSFSTNTYSCRYTITKSSPDVCRLRLNFRYFNFGTEDPYCNYGFVEIDGRRFCGCKTGQNTQVLFTDYIAKTIFITFAGYPRKFGGFLIDVFQESCGIGGSYPTYPQNPSYPYDPNNPIYPGYGNSYIQRRNGFSNNTTNQHIISKKETSDFIASQPDPNQNIRNKRDLGYLYPQPSVPFVNKDVQLVPAIVGGTSHERIFSGSCQSRAFFDWVIASKEALFRNVRCLGGSEYRNPGWNSRRYLPPSNKRIGRSTSAIECEEIVVNHGSVKSPQYPNQYQNNTEKCYRFLPTPNSCKIKVHIRDFDLETSPDCSKDYLKFSIDDKKYCGHSLSDSKLVFDLTQTNAVEVYFVTDSRGTGKGFEIDFSQLPCEMPTNSKE